MEQFFYVNQEIIHLKMNSQHCIILLPHSKIYLLVISGDAVSRSSEFFLGGGGGGKLAMDHS